jgi:hypothetical protein
VTGVGLRQRFGTLRERVSGERRRQSGAIERRDVEAEFRRQRMIEVQQPRCGCGDRLPRSVKPLEFAGERVVEAERSE